MSIFSFLSDLFSTPSSSATQGGGFGGRSTSAIDKLLDAPVIGRPSQSYADLLPPVQDNLVSAPSSAESAQTSVDSYADYSSKGSYDDYLAMLQKGADIGLFSTAQDVVNEAQKDRLFQSLEADKERAWYEDLANTSFQRQVKDLQAAGLNPILGFANLGTGSVTAHTAVPTGRATNLTSIAPNLSDYLNAGANLISSASSIVNVISKVLGKSTTKSIIIKG